MNQQSRDFSVFYSAPFLNCGNKFLKLHFYLFLQDARESLNHLRQELAPLMGIQSKPTTGTTTSTTATATSTTNSKSVLELIKEIQQDVRKGKLGDDNVDRRNFSSPSQIGENLSFEEMRATIHQFMKLFDVKKENAVYTRIYDLYVRYFEMLNAFHSLRQILHLSELTLLFENPELRIVTSHFKLMTRKILISF